MMSSFPTGTSHHISMGTMAITSLMIAAVIDQQVLQLGHPVGTTPSSANTTEIPVFESGTTGIDMVSMDSGITAADHVSLLLLLLLFVCLFVCFFLFFFKCC